jgi:hypothetical protein
MTTLAYIYIILAAILTFLGATRLIGTRNTITPGYAFGGIILNLLEALAVYTLWYNSSYMYRTPIAVVMWVFQAIYILDGVRLTGKLHPYTMSRAITAVSLAIFGIVAASLLYFNI